MPGGPLPFHNNEPNPSLPTSFSSTTFNATRLTRTPPLARPFTTTTNNVHGLSIQTTSMFDPANAAPSMLENAYGYPPAVTHRHAATVSPTALHGVWAPPLSDLRGHPSGLGQGYTAAQIDPALQNMRGLGPQPPTGSAFTTGSFYDQDTEGDDSETYIEDSLAYAPGMYHQIYQDARNAEMTEKSQGRAAFEQHEQDDDSEWSNSEPGRQDSSLSTRGERRRGRPRGRGRPLGSSTRARSGGPGSRGTRIRGGRGRGSRGGLLHPKSQGGKGGWTRNPVACTHCQRRHIRCEGGPPCQRCKQRTLDCEVASLGEDVMPLITSRPLDRPDEEEKQ
ncbi:hypothetical protein IAR50_001156 [Cryptococcus sp. DSM 104548]